MNVVLFCHSLLSDWNHGNAHFLRGVVTELIERRARVDVYEPRDAWSVENLVAERARLAELARARALQMDPDVIAAQYLSAYASLARSRPRPLDLEAVA